MSSSNRKKTCSHCFFGRSNICSCSSFVLSSRAVIANWKPHEFWWLAFSSNLFSCSSCLLYSSCLSGVIIMFLCTHTQTHSHNWIAQQHQNDDDQGDLGIQGPPGEHGEKGDKGERGKRGKRVKKDTHNRTPLAPLLYNTIREYNTHTLRTYTRSPNTNLFLKDFLCVSLRTTFLFSNDLHVFSKTWTLSSNWLSRFFFSQGLSSNWSLEEKSSFWFLVCFVVETLFLTWLCTPLSLSCFLFISLPLTNQHQMFLLLGSLTTLNVFRWSFLEFSLIFLDCSHASSQVSSLTALSLLVHDWFSLLLHWSLFIRVYSTFGLLFMMDESFLQVIARETFPLILSVKSFPLDITKKPTTTTSTRTINDSSLAELSSI